MGIRQPPSLTHHGAWPVWILSNAVGYAVGFALWQVVFPMVRPALSASLGGVLLLAGFGATVGCCAGVAQSVGRRGSLIEASRWALAVVVGTTVGFIAGATVSARVNGAMYPRLTLAWTDAAVVLSFGLMLGLCIGMARWLVLLAQGERSPRWLAASTLGMLIGYPLAIGVLELLPELDQPWVGLVFGACAGATAALLEWLIMPHAAANTLELTSRMGHNQGAN